MKEETRQAAAMKKILDKRDAREYKKAKEAEKAAGQQATDATAGEKPFNQLAYQNDFIREKYDRVNLTLPKGKKTIVKQRAAGLNKSVNEYINDLIAADLAAAEPKKFYYGMRLRGYSIGCQPGGVLERIDDPKGRYHDIIVYDHKLSDNDTLHFSLDYLENGTD